MEFTREFVDGRGNRFVATVTVKEDGFAFERAVQILANRARDARDLHASAAHGMVVVSVKEVSS